MKLLTFLLLLSCTMPDEIIKPDPCPHHFRFIDEKHIDIDIESELPEVEIRITEQDGSGHSLTVRREFYRCLTVGVDSRAVVVEVWGEGYCLTEIK
jgi:hypothetical protein